MEKNTLNNARHITVPRCQLILYCGVIQPCTICSPLAACQISSSILCS